MFSHAEMAMRHSHDLPYSVELWDNANSHVEEIALTGDYGVARAAFDEAVRRRPGRIVTLRQKTKLLADSVAKISTSVPARTNLRLEEAALR